MKYTDPELDGVTVIFGHTPTQHYQDNNPLEIWYSSEGGRIGIDCGSGYPMTEALRKYTKQGRLACLRLEDMKVYYSEDDMLEEVEEDVQ